MLHNHNRLSQSSQQPQSSKLPIPQSLLIELQNQKEELYRIRQQQKTIYSIDETLRKKNSELVRLSSLVQKFEPYYKKYQDLSYQHSQKSAKLHQKQKQLAILLKQLNELITQNQHLQKKFHQCDKQRSSLLTEQREIERVNHEIEQTFKLYQEECKKKEMGLLRDLEKAYKQVTELNKRIDQCQMRVVESQEVKKRMGEKIAELEQEKSNLAKEKALWDVSKQQQATQQQNQANLPGKPKYHSSFQSQSSNPHLLQLRQQNDFLKNAFTSLESELTKYKLLNQQLSIEFDKSVSRICDFQKQLTRYRQQNHELQKMLNLFVEKEKYEKMHLRQLEKVTKQGRNGGIREGNEKRRRGLGRRRESGDDSSGEFGSGKKNEDNEVDSQGNRRQQTGSDDVNLDQ